MTEAGLLLLPSWLVLLDIVVVTYPILQVAAEAESVWGDDTNKAKQGSFILISDWFFYWTALTVRKSSSPN